MQKWLTLFLFLFSSLSAKNYVVLTGRDAGMFSVMHDALALFRGYERGDYLGIEVDFGYAGLYFDPMRGKNWWDYYFEPVHRGKKKNVVKQAHLVDNWCHLDSSTPEFRQEACTLFNIYAILLPHITEKIETFYTNQMRGWYIIGVHYRGTDKIKEAPRLSYEAFASKIEAALLLHPNENVRIFVATDETDFIDYLRERQFNLCYVEEMLRSKDKATPVHINSTDPYKAGEDALVDCFLLSKCDLFIRSDSNMSTWVTFLNPTIPAI